jgi:hypothetical protein
VATVLGWLFLGVGVAAGMVRGWLILRLRTEQKLQNSKSTAWSRWLWPDDFNWSPAGQRVADRSFNYFVIGLIAFLLGLVLLLAGAQK